MQNDRRERNGDFVVARSGLTVSSSEFRRVTNFRRNRSRCIIDAAEEGQEEDKARPGRNEISAGIIGIKAGPITSNLVGKGGRYRASLRIKY